MSSELSPSVTVIANEPNATYIAEKLARRQPRSAAEDSYFEDVTIIASNPESTCTAEPYMELTDPSDTFRDHTLGSFRIIANDPSTTCLAESKLVNGNGNGNDYTRSPSEPIRYRPAYMLQDESLERAGRVSGGVLLGRV